MAVFIEGDSEARKQALDIAAWLTQAASPLYSPVNLSKKQSAASE